VVTVVKKKKNVPLGIVLFNCLSVIYIIAI